MVSVLEGQLSRTWYFLNQGRNHVINLYHDTITGEFMLFLSPFGLILMVMVYMLRCSQCHVGFQ